jgi:hypothetical protein
MADLQQSDEQTLESRTDAFSGGVAGGGAAHIASSLPRVQQATPTFDPTSSVLLAANTYSGVGNGSSSGTMRISNPFGQAMKDQLQSSGSGKATQ